MLTMTPGAVSEVKRLLSKEKPEVGLRIGVRSGGCSGFSYVLGFDAPTPEDRVQDIEGIKLLIDSKSAPYLDGTQLDFQSGLQGKGFAFSNPNATKSCGCGESFSV
jgi:iron-sulfur cluster assembly accessory protein